MRNSTAVVDTPSTTVEVTVFTPAMPATASSTCLVTCVSISAGAAPDWVTVTATMGTSMDGKRVMGRVLKLCHPRIRSSTKARIGATGLRIDQAEKFIPALLGPASRTRFPWWWERELERSGLRPSGLCRSGITAIEELARTDKQLPDCGLNVR